ncbi:hypothetical protein B0A55_09845 [Friedmanniomyces simplex]|uniref:GST N-terminal domain-containing protein n=1 Tax=Friedmanniomyces simplex TaxID=329884 RepID=A0A4V5NER2_9PEZI|nr:hypothetical protein B0A55_09845 [Friedmanniomyces simplex]
MASVTQPTKPNLRLWTLAWGLYPRRITIYMKEKGIIDDIEIVTVHFTKEGKMGSALGKPPGKSLPSLVVARLSEDGQQPGMYLYQSVAILEYLEELYAGPAMIGSTPWKRARTRDCPAVLDEAVAFFACYEHNASAGFAGREPQNAEAARISLVRAYDVDLRVEHTRLKVMYEAFEGRHSAEWDDDVPGMLREASGTMSSYVTYNVFRTEELEADLEASCRRMCIMQPPTAGEVIVDARSLPALSNKGHGSDGEADRTVSDRMIYRVPVTSGQNFGDLEQEIRVQGDIAFEEKWCVDRVDLV